MKFKQWATFLVLLGTFSLTTTNVQAASSKTTSSESKTSAASESKTTASSEPATTQKAPKLHTTSSKKIKYGAASTEPMVSKKVFNQVINDYPALKKGKDQAITLPGLQGAWSLDKAGKMVKVKTFDVQGLALSDEYMYVSAYDDAKKANSVIYVISRKTNKYVKTIVLKGRPHVGGLAFDMKTDSLWFADDKKVAPHTKRISRLSRIDLKQIEKYDLAKSKKPIKYQQSIDLPDTRAISTLCYYDKALWIGYFNSDRSGTIQKYDVNYDKKTKQTLIGVKSKGIWDASRPDKAFDGIEQMQGITATGRSVLVSSSFGNDPSRLVHFHIDNKNDQIVSPDYVEMPPYMEQVAYDGDKTFYAIFESNAPRYRYNTNQIVDRIVKFKVSDIKAHGKKYDRTIQDMMK